MKRRVPKSLYFSVLFLFIMLAEGAVVVYDLFHQDKDVFTLATAEYDVPMREVKVLPFMFETHGSEEFDVILDDVAEEISTSLLNKIVDKPAELIRDDVANSSENSGEKSSDIEVAVEKLFPPLRDDIEKDVSIAIVVDDMGVSPSHTRNIISIAKPLTASFLTYGASSRQQVEAAKNAGLGVMLHTPMMPHNKADLAPVTLSPEMTETEIKRHLLDMMFRYEGLGLPGINNHMGSLFTEDAKSMEYVMQVLKKYDMFFLDSKTTSKSVAKEVAEKYGVPYIARDVFLDNENDYNYIMKQLRETEKIARQRGYAVAICHPHSETYKALRDWVNNLEEKHIRLVHLDILVKELNKKM